MRFIRREFGEQKWWGSAHRGIAIGVAGLAALLLLPAASADAAQCKQPKGNHEPPCNPFLAESPWGVTHRGSYAQGSSPFRGVENSKATSQHLDVRGTPIAIQFSDRYDDGGRAAWLSMVDTGTANGQALSKIDVDTGELIDTYVPGQRESQPPESGGGITGAYNLLDRSGRFFVPRERSFDVYKDSVSGDRFSEIKLRKRYKLPESAFCGADDRLVGATMTYDGYLAFATARGVVGTVPRQPKQMQDSALRTINLNEGSCDAGDDQLETVSNNIAADERGGIYVVTSERMRRIDHRADQNELKSKWSAPYNAGPDASEIRLGQGSGSTPSLMGTGPGQDKFVAVTDGQDLMHMDLFWRNKVPGDWQGLDAEHPRRQACEYLVRFGDPDATTALSEQSIAVRGYGTFHVNNSLDYTFPSALPPVLINALAAIRGGDPAAAPYGAERIDWDPDSRACGTVWANDEVSIPNGVPSVSQRSGLAYGISQIDGEWGVTGLDWKTGRRELFAAQQDQVCSQGGFDLLEEAGLAGLLVPLLEELPNTCGNSTYAATTIGPGNSIWTGTFLGVTIYRPG